MRVARISCVSTPNNAWRLNEVRCLFSAVILSMVTELASAADIVITADTPPAINNDQRCSLVEAIINANDDDRTHSDCVAGNGPDVIVLPTSSTQVLTSADNSVYGPTGLPVITSTITIEGNGSTLVRESGAPLFRILAVAKSGELRLQKTNIRGGASQRYGDVSQNGGVGYGDPSQGGAVLNYGMLEVADSEIADNSAVSGGGGIHSEGGTLLVRDSLFSGNAANGAGGAVSQIRNYGTLVNFVCSGNTAWLYGGCMWVGGTSTVTMTTSTIRDNYSHASGGGLRAEWNSVLLVTDSTISGNGALGAGGGISVGAHAVALVQNTSIADNMSEVEGGGIVAEGTLALVKNSTVSGNLAPRGGGVVTGTGGTTRGTTTLMSSTVALNQASLEGGGVINSSPGPLFLSHTLIAGNTAMSQPSEVQDDTGSAIANAFNLFGYDGNAASVGFTAKKNDIVPTSSLGEILDAELRNNGGPTDTHALIAGSPAIDAGDPKFSNMTAGSEWMYDQRGPGFLRFDPESRTVDIGAFEYQ